MPKTKEELLKEMEETKAKLAYLEAEDAKKELVKSLGKEAKIEAKKKAKEDEAKASTLIGEQYITKAAAAIEVRRYAKTSFNLAILGIGLMFICCIAITFNMLAGTAVAVISSIILGYFGVKANIRVKELEKAYNLK